MVNKGDRTGNGGQVNSPCERKVTEEIHLKLEALSGHFAGDGKT